MKYKIEPFRWQKQAILRGMHEQELGIFAEQGCGKTCALINIIRGRFLEHKRYIKTVIFAPQVTLNNWMDEFEKHSNIPTTKIHNAGTAHNRVKNLEGFMLLDEGIILINYEALVSTSVFNLLYKWSPMIVVCDESHYVKNYKSQRSKKVKELADQALHRYLLTGTPFLNSVQDLYGQFRILDGGRTFGKNYFLFRAQYMVDRNAMWSSKPAYFPNWEDNPNTFGELQTKVAKKSMRILKKDCLDLPPLIEQKIEVPMSPEQKKLYKTMERDCITFMKDKAVVAQTALTKLLRLQQIVSGHVKTENDEEIVISTNPRLDILMEQIEVLKQHKVIVWCSFKKDVELIAKRLTAKNIGYEQLTGAQSAMKKAEAIESFRFEKNTQVLIANRRAGGVGINLCEAQYSIVYSRNFSLADELQSKARNHRKGSEIHSSVVKIDLVTPDTTDEITYQALQNKEMVSKAILDSVGGFR